MLPLTDVKSEVLADEGSDGADPLVFTETEESKP